MSDLLVVRAKLKDAMPKGKEGKPVNVSGDFADALDKKVRQLILDAARRASENGRNTIMAKDL